MTKQIPMELMTNTNTQKAIDAIRTERIRQQAFEGYRPEADDRYEVGQLGMAAACYASPVPVFVQRFAADDHSEMEPRHYNAWPWDKQHDKRAKHDRMKQLTIAGALIVAEMERLMRLESSSNYERSTS